MVGYEGDEEVGARVDALEEEERFGVGGGRVQFGDEGEEGDVAWCDYCE